MTSSELLDRNIGVSKGVPGVHIRMPDLKIETGKQEYNTHRSTLYYIDNRDTITLNHKSKLSQCKEIFTENPVLHMYMNTKNIIYI